MSAHKPEDPVGVVAREASRRLEWSRRAQLNRELTDRRHYHAAEVASSLAGILRDLDGDDPGAGRP